jgi:hypothetical protein
VGATVEIGATVSEVPPQAEAHKNKQASTESFFTSASLTHLVGMTLLGYLSIDTTEWQNRNKQQFRNFCKQE